MISIETMRTIVFNWWCFWSKKNIYILITSKRDIQFNYILFLIDYFISYYIILSFNVKQASQNKIKHSSFQVLPLSTKIESIY